MRIYIYASLARLAGLDPVVEPRKLPAHDDAKQRDGRHRLRPDIILYGLTSTLLVDVSLVHPFAPSHVSGHRDDDKDKELRIIKVRETLKEKKYEKLAKRFDGGRVVPFLVTLAK